MLQEVVYYDDANSKYGMIAYPLGGVENLPLVIFLNAGLVDRQGPNRIYVKLCHALNDIGFTCFRFNLPGIGDNINNGKYVTKEQMYKEELHAVITYFRTTKNIKSFILFGICTGADLAYDYALNDYSIAGIGIVNGLSMASDPFDYNLDKRYYQKYLTDVRRWMKFISFRKLLKIPQYVLMVLLYLWRKLRMSSSVKNTEEERKIPDDTDVTAEWIRLLNSNLEILQIVAEGSESFDGLHHVHKEIKVLSTSRRNYREHIIFDADHTFTSLTSQHDLIAKVVAWCHSRFLKKKQDANVIENWSVL